jgi:high-affinity nickel-transport protein
MGAVMGRRARRSDCRHDWRMLPVLLLAEGPAAVGLLATALVLGIRHGFDWDHLAAIADVTSTSTTAEVAEDVHEAVHERPGGHMHGHGGVGEIAAHDAGARAILAAPDTHPHLAARSGDDHAGVGSAEAWTGAHVPVTAVHVDVGTQERRALALGSLYAVGHATAVAALGTLALLFGAVLPGWVDPIMGRVVGFTLLVLGVWVFVSLYQYVRHGREFRLRSRWMLVFDSVRYGWRRFQAWLHGHEHVEPIEMTSYGPKAAFGVGVIHGVGAETGTQVLLIAAIGGAAGQGLGIPMLAAFIVGLLISNSLVVLVTATGFIASRVRERLYVGVGVLAGAFSLVIGAVFLLDLQDALPALDRLLG